MRGGNGLWSDPANWSGGVPADGDEVLFGAAGGGDSFDGLTLSLAAFRFDAAILPEHNFHLTAGASLTLTGFGINNQSSFVSGGGGVIRQQFYMEAGSTMTFQNSATITGNLPVDLNAMGGTTAGASGGRIIFEHNSTASGPPGYAFTGLRVYGAAVAGAAVAGAAVAGAAVAGAAVAGAGGGELRFRDDAKMGETAGFGNHAGQVAGALGGLTVFGDRAMASGSVSNQTGDGLGGRIIFQDNAVAGGSLGLNNYGATHLELGAEAVTQFLNDSVLSGTVQNFSGLIPGAAGGRLEFHNHARFDGTPIPPELGSIVILNRGSFTPFGMSGTGFGGQTVFYDDTRVLGANVVIGNWTESEGPNPGGVGGTTEFLDRSRAGQATINNHGASSGVAGTLGGRTYFRGYSSAENANIVSNGGSHELAAPGGFVEFSGASTAANATLTATSGTDGGLGGRILFAEMANGGAARVTVESGGVFDMSALTTAGTTLGSIEGAGSFFLGNKTLTVGSTGLSTVVSGVVSDGGQAGGAGAALTKVGTGTLELGGINTYTGPTNVNAGALLVTGALGNGAVAVANGATLGGTGTIGGAVTVADGGRIAPGAAGTFGTLTTGPLTLSAGTQLDFQLRDGAHDQIAVNGPLTLDGILNVAAPSGLTLGIYRLFDYTGALTDNGLVLGTLPAGTTTGEFTILTNTPGEVNLVLGGEADLLFWDGSQTAPNNVVNGGAGTWNNATTNWTNAAGSVQRDWNGRAAVFSGGAGSVTLGEDVSVNGMQFVTSNYIVNPGGGDTITLVGAAPVRVDGARATINASFDGSGTLVKTGDGALTLTGVSNHTGGTIVIDGLLTVTNSAGLGLGTGPVTVRASPTSYLHFVGSSSAGNLSITNEGSAADFSGVIQFFDTATAGSATLTNGGNTAAGGFGGFTYFDNASRAGTAAIHNLGAAFDGPSAAVYADAGGGRTHFRGSSNAEAAAITNDAGLGSGLYGGQTYFYESASAGTAAIFNRGGAVAGALGGLTQFSGSAHANTATLTVEGGANGGLGGTIRFTQTAAGGFLRVIFLPGGAADGLLDISGTSAAAIAIGSIEGNGLIALGDKRLEVGGNNLETEFSGAISGFGGSLRKVGVSMLTLVGDSSYTGGTTVFDGVLRVTNPNGLGLGTGPVTVQTTPTSELRFSLTGSAGAVAITNEGSVTSAYAGGTTFRSSATAANASIVNRGSLANGALGGFTEFYATSRAGNATFDNQGSTFLGGGGPGGGDSYFFESSTADTATIFNQGGLANGAEGGQTNFWNSSSAGTSTISNFSAVAAGAFQGATVFRDASTAAAAMINNAGSVLNGAAGGVTEFFNAAMAGSANLTNQGSSAAGAAGGVTRFFGDSNGGAATLNNRAGTVASAIGGQTTFTDSSDAAAGTLDNEGGKFAFDIAGFTEFRGSSAGGSGLSTNRAGQVANASGGDTVFYDSAKAGSRQFVNEGGSVANGYAGQLTFAGGSKAENATISNRGSTVAGAFEGGATFFLFSSTAGSATIINEGTSIAQGFGGITTFEGSEVSAGNATVTNAGGLAVGFGPVSSGGATRFTGGASAGSGIFTNDAGLGGPGGVVRASGGRIEFADGSNAGSGTFFNRGGVPAVSGGRITFTQTARADAGNFINEGGLSTRQGDGEANIIFSDTASAGTATILNVGGTLATSEGGETLFFVSSKAESATITAGGASAPGGIGGRISFTDSSRAGSATLTAESGSNGGGGGLIRFMAASDGQNALVSLGAAAGGSAGELDISALSTTGMSIGSLEGGGIVRLGSKNLASGGNGLNTEFSGTVAGVGGSLTKVGAGALTLYGASTYTGGTTINQGKLIAANTSGSATGTGAVTINAGGTLGGSGFIAGPVILNAGGVVAPGDPVTLTLEDSFIWNGGSTIRLALGPDQAGSDLVIVLGSLIKGTDGEFLFDLVDFGVVAGQTYELIRFENLEGFNANDFTFTGVPGTFALGDGFFGYTATVPEPSSCVLLLAGVAWMFLARRGAQRLRRV